MSFGIIGDFRAEKVSGVSAFSGGLGTWFKKAINWPNSEAIHDYGSSVTIGIVDSGYTPTPGLPEPVYTSVFGYKEVTDNAEHGTHVFSVLNDIAPNATFMICRVLDGNGNGMPSQIAKGIVDLVDAGADIINVSIGGPGKDKPVLNAVKYAEEKGVLIVAASGNTGKKQKMYPAAFEQVVAVGGINKHFELSSISTTGDQIDLVAPCEGILVRRPNGDYMTVRGTSFAAPIVSGVAALTIDHFLLHHGRKPSLEELKNSLMNNAEDLGILGWDNRYGHGLTKVRFHKEQKALKVEPPKWMNTLTKLLGWGFRYWLKRQIDKVTL